MKSYVLKENFRAPYVVATGMPHNPQAIKSRLFKKGDIVKGELKHVNNVPAFILVNGALPIDVSYIKEVQTKDIVEMIPLDKEGKSSADGEATTTPKEESKTLEMLKSANPKVKYMDAVIIGGLVGIAGVYLANKQGWIPELQKKHYLIGGIAGAVLSSYLVYRFTAPKQTVKVAVKKPDMEKD
jgi:hypothetical protein